MKFLVFCFVMFVFLFLFRLQGQMKHSKFKAFWDLVKELLTPGGSWELLNELINLP